MMQVIGVFGAGYRVEIMVLFYNNPTNVCAERPFSCCDRLLENGDPCTEETRCDNLFQYCLRPSNTTASARSCTSLVGSEVISEVSLDGATIDFTQSIVLGLPNPFILEGLTERFEVHTCT